MMGNLVPFCPKAKVDDGLLDLIIVHHASLSAIVGAFNKSETASHIDGEVVEQFQVQSYTLEPIGKSLETAKGGLTGEKVTNVDGELVGWAPFTVTCVPKALTVITGL